MVPGALKNPRCGRGFLEMPRSLTDSSRAQHAAETGLLDDKRAREDREADRHQVGEVVVVQGGDDEQDRREDEEQSP
jgi:hypothetical protein